MDEIVEIAALRERVRGWRQAGERIGLVPTMGNLHGGHLTLVDKALAECDRVVVSIFVNPTQFVPGEDFAAYPRTYEADCGLLAERGIDVVFAPEVAEIYPNGPTLRTQVAVPALDNILCGVSRPGHFRGVATVVAKLLNIVQPDVAVFGLKDYQQLLVIEHMVRDLSLPVAVLGAAIAREPNGLAMSSRNVYLNTEQREQAGVLYATLTTMAERLRQGDHDRRGLIDWGQAQIQAAGLALDYLELRRSSDLADLRRGDTHVVIAVAAYLGQARLIDNVQLALPPPGLTED